MTSKHAFFTYHSTLLYDQFLLPNEQACLPFALTDVFTEYTQRNQLPIIHFWQVQNTVILGMKDTALPHLSAGLHSLQKDGYQVIVRNSGGLGVVADTGVLNVSLIIPQPSQKRITIDEAYTLMYWWINYTFETSSNAIKAFEIKQSYCPGAFDLSINGKKFAGISQRRVKKGIAIMIYLSVTGSQKKRSESIQRFYLKGLQGATSKTGYPKVDPSCMENLSALTNRPLTINEVKDNLLHTFKQYFSPNVDNHLLTDLVSSEWFKDRVEKQTLTMQQRNNQIEPFL